MFISLIGVRASMRGWQKLYKVVPLLMMGVCFSVKQNEKNSLNVTLNSMKFYCRLLVVVSLSMIQNTLVIVCGSLGNAQQTMLTFPN